MTRTSRAASWLPVMIRLTAVGYLLFFVPDLVFALTDRANTLFDWGAGRDPVAVMFATVYIVWAMFLFAAAKAPLAHRLFLDFNLAANSAHFAVMLVMAIALPDQHHHLAGVVTLGLLTTVPMAACWLPVRRSQGR